jgi:hypothetical protein
MATTDDTFVREMTHRFVKYIELVPYQVAQSISGIKSPSVGAVTRVEFVHRSVYKWRVLSWMNPARCFFRFGYTAEHSPSQPPWSPSVRSHMANAIIIRHGSPFMSHTLLLFILLVRVLRHTLLDSAYMCGIDFFRRFLLSRLGVFAEVGNFDDD